MTHALTIIDFLTDASVLVGLIIIGIYLYLIDRSQKQHPVLRNYPVIGRTRYFLETMGPELRQYLFNSDNEGQPLSRSEYLKVPGIYSFIYMN